MKKYHCRRLCVVYYSENTTTIAIAIIIISNSIINIYLHGSWQTARGNCDFQLSNAPSHIRTPKHLHAQCCAWFLLTDSSLVAAGAAGAATAWECLWSCHLLTNVCMYRTRTTQCMNVHDSNRINGTHANLIDLAIRFTVKAISNYTMSFTV